MCLRVVFFLFVCAGLTLATPDRICIWTTWCGPSEAIAADLTFSVTLSDTQQIALTYATEQENVRRIGQQDCTPAVPPAIEPKCIAKLPLTQTQMLAQIVVADLTNVLRNLDASIVPVLDNLKALDATTLTKVLATVSSAATQARIQQLIEVK